MTYLASLGKNGEIKLPTAILEQVKADGFVVSFEGQNLVLMPIRSGDSDFGAIYANLTPEQRGAEFREALSGWRKKYPKTVGLSDEQLKREHIYEE
jgi:hypothetical protein